MNILREIKQDDFPLLRSFLETKLNSSVTIMALLDVQEKFKFSRPIYVTQDDPTKFIFAKNIMSNGNFFSVFWDTERIDDNELKKYLLSVPDCNWDEKFVFASMDDKLAQKLDSLLVNGGVSSKTLKRSYSEPSLIHKLKEEKFHQRNLPDGFTFGVIQDFHIPYMFTKWKYNEDETVENFQKCLKIFPSTALYKDDDLNHNFPISWVLVYNYGFIGFMYTEPKYRRLGLGTCVFNYQCSKLINENMMILTQVNLDNEESLEMHRKLGFEIISKAYWNEYECISNNF